VIVFRSPPAAVHRALFGALAPIARWRAYRSTYPQLSRTVLASPTCLRAPDFGSTLVRPTITSFHPIQEVRMSRVGLSLAALVVIAAPAYAQDPVKVAPKIYSVVLENADVRVLRAVLNPGDKTALHEHPATVVIPQTAGTGRFTGADGKSQDMTMTAGTPLYMPSGTHAVENIGKTRTEVLVIELKGKK
jgi:quercetin dioxygenase-like cupin family protein